MHIGYEREIDDSCRLLDAFRRRRFRTRAQFAEDEIIVPNGPHADNQFRLSTQPFSRLFYDEIDSGKYTEIVVTGPSQTGKTLQFFVIPLLYHLFEIGENVIGAVPDYDIVSDKIEQDIEPVLRLTRYWRYMPAVGRGSKGGRAPKIKFKNGVELRWMTAGGGDKSRSAYTARVVCMTETDGFDTQSTTSQEASKIAQIEARQRAYDIDKRLIYKECTVTTKTAHTWARYSAGTASRLVLPCPHCDSWEVLERNDLVGWKSASTDIEASESTFFHCPACGEKLSEEDRRQANIKAKLLHKGQSIVNGQIEGETPRTRTLGLRWSAANNLLISAGSIGVDEWEAARATDEDDAQRKLCQFVWSVPYVPIEDDNEDDITAESLVRRVSGLLRSQYPEGSKIALGIDVNKPVLHWTATALQVDGPGHIIDYGKTGLKTRDIGFAAALTEGLQRLRERLEVYPFVAAGIDSRWRPDDIADAIKSLKDKRFRAFVGCGKGQFNAPAYSHPLAVGGDVIRVGNNWYEKRIKARKHVAVYANANFWKKQLALRLMLEGGEAKKIDSPLRLYSAVEENEHFQFCRHLTAEEERQEFEPKKGIITVFHQLRKQNHYLDSTYISLVMGDRALKKRHPSGNGSTPPPADNAESSQQWDSQSRFSA